MRKNFFYLVLILGLTAAFALPAYADITGCVDSPENPTVLLALVGSAGAGTVFLRSRWRSRRRK